MFADENRAQKIVMESLDVTSKVLLGELSGKCTTEEAVASYCRFLSHVKDFFGSEEPSLPLVDGTSLSASFHSIGGLLAMRNEYKYAVEAYTLSFATISLIDPRQMSLEDMVACLYESIEECVHDPLAEGNSELVDGIYEAALHCPLAQDPTVRDGICRLRDNGSAVLAQPFWEDDDDDDDPPSIVEYHEGTGNIPSSIPMETRVPFDEHAFSEGMSQTLNIHDRPIIAADIDTITDLEMQGFGIRWACDLAFMPRLRFVNLASNAISDAKFISELHEVEMLILGGNQIEDLSPFAGMHALTALDLSDNAIIDVSPLAELTGLRDLNLDNNHIHSISPLNRLEGLETLSIASNPLTDSKRFLELTSLQLLYVSREQVEEDILTKLQEHGVVIQFREKPIADAN